MQNLSNQNMSNTIHVKKVLGDLRMFLVLIGITILFAILSPYFLTIRNLYAVGLTMSGIGVICAGQAVVLLTGEFDISVGSIVGFCGMLVALLTKNFEHYILMVFVGLGTGALIGFSNGLLITKGRVPALIQTFSYLSIFQGATFLLSNGYAVGVNQDAFRFLGTTRVFSIPLPIIILVLIYTVFHIVLKYTKFGRYIYSVGGNIEAARLSGINVDRVKILAYVISGTLSAFGGIMLASRLGSAQTLAGSQYPLNSIAACVLGGVSIGGGVGAIFGALIGVAIVAILKSGLIMIDMPSYWQWIAIGVVLITAVYFDVRRKEK